MTLPARNQMPDWAVRETAAAKAQQSTHLHPKAASDAFFVSAGTRALGDGQEALNVQPGRALVAGTEAETAGVGSVDIDGGDGLPRRDVVYVTEDGGFAVEKGDPGGFRWDNDLSETEQTITNAQRPAPPDMVGVTGFPLAVITVPKNAGTLPAEAITELRAEPPAARLPDHDHADGVLNPAEVNGVLSASDGTALQTAIDSAASDGQVARLDPDCPKFGIGVNDCPIVVKDGVTLDLRDCVLNLPDAPVVFELRANATVLTDGMELRTYRMAGQGIVFQWNADNGSQGTSKSAQVLGFGTVTNGDGVVTEFVETGGASVSGSRVELRVQNCGCIAQLRSSGDGFVNDHDLRFRGAVNPSQGPDGATIHLDGVGGRVRENTITTDQLQLKGTGGDVVLCEGDVAHNDISGVIIDPNKGIDNILHVGPNGSGNNRVRAHSGYITIGGRDNPEELWLTDESDNPTNRIQLLDRPHAPPRDLGARGGANAAHGEIATTRQGSTDGRLRPGVYDADTGAWHTVREGPRRWSVSAAGSTQYYQIGRLASESGGNYTGNAHIRLYGAVVGATRSLSVDLAARNSTFRTPAVDERSTAASGDNTAEVVVTRETGTNPNGGDRFWIYVEAQPYTDAEVTFESGEFGAVVFQSGLTASDLKGTEEYRTE